MARRTIDPSVKTAVLAELANGTKVKDVAVKFGLSVPTVYNYRNEAAKVVEPVQA